MDEENSTAESGAVEPGMDQPELRYKYRSIDPDSDEIRLLILKPGHGAKKIACSLRHALLAPGKDLDYETVSYCWGDPTPKVNTSIDGFCLKVPLSTAEVLQRFRHEDQERLIWIDSICINQVDTRERSHQVKQMKEIYTSATRNLIWLGHDDGTSAVVLRVFQEFLEEIRSDTDDFKTFPGSVATWELHARSGTKVNFDSDTLVRFCSRPWFSRVWIIQEATLAKSNLCHVGKHTFDLLDLLRVAVWIWNKREHIPLWFEARRNFEPVRNTFARTLFMASLIDQEFGWFSFARKRGWWEADGAGEDAPLSALLGHLRPFAASEPVDHIFGLLGLYERFSGNNVAPHALIPDYYKTAAEVFSNATRYALAESRSLALYQHHHRRIDDSNELSLPSWVPRWHYGFEAGLDPTPFIRGFSSSKDWLAGCFQHPPEEPLKIMLGGILVDCKAGARIYSVSEPMLDQTPSLEFLQSIQAMATSHHGELHLIDDNKVLKVHLTHVCTAGENAELNQLSSGDYHGYEDYIHYHKLHGKPPPYWQDITLGNHETQEGELEWRAARFLEACFMACSLRRFFITTAGRLGLGPDTMEVGDYVTVLYGGEWPFILRSCDDDDEWEMIGTSYSPTIMDGSAVREHEERSDADIIFTIR